MPKHAKPILVLVWPDGYREDSVEALIDDWDGRGGFTLPADGPAAQAIWDRAYEQECVITVLDSPELEWVVEWVTLDGNNTGRTMIRCTPRADRLRNLLTSWARIRGMES